MTQHILIAEDDPKTANLVKLYLEKNGYDVTAVNDGRSALDIARVRLPDLMVLDVMMPHLDGLDVCRILRADEATKQIPIIMLTARSTEDDMLLGLDLGADDYITKPFSPREVVARVRTVLRRANAHADNGDVLEIGGLRVDLTQHEVYVDGNQVYLTPKEFKLLEVLMRSPNRVFPRGDLVEKAFGINYDGLDRTVDVHVMKLRKKVEVDASQPRYIHTVYGVGYKFMS
ncbi:MAG: response regulator transcription factor [Chloroflexota bacterium]